MSKLPLEPWHIPLRVATGAFLLHSGLSKRGADEDTAQGLQGFASTAFPQAQSMEPTRFANRLGTAEVALGTALLVPLVPSSVAGAALTAFAGGLNRLYWKAPGMRQEGDIRPTESGMGLAKDAWMTAIGMALVIDGVSDRRRNRRRRRSRSRAR